MVRTSGLQRRPPGAEYSTRAAFSTAAATSPLAASKASAMTRCRKAAISSAYSSSPLRGLGLDSTGRPEMPAAHLSPAVPPGVGVAHPAPLWSISMFTERPRAWYTDGEPLFQPAWAVLPKTLSPGGSGGSLLSLTRGPRDATHAWCAPGPPPGRLAPLAAPPPAPEHTASLDARPPTTVVTRAARPAPPGRFSWTATSRSGRVHCQ